MKITKILFPRGVLFTPRSGTFELTNFQLPVGQHFGKINIDVDFDESIDWFIDHRKKLCRSKITSLSIVPTTKCNGKCTYCYAKKDRDNEHYIDPITISNAILKLNEYDHTEVSDIKNVIIYGGDSVTNTDKLEDIIRIFDNTTKIEVVTGLLYDDETFNKLINLMYKYKNFSVCCSIDPINEDGTYTRVYNGVNDVYNFLIDRIKLLKSKYPNKVGLRITVTNTNYKFEKILHDLSDGELFYRATVEPVDDTEIDKDVFQYICDAIQDINDDIPYPLAPARRFTKNLKQEMSFYNPYGDCPNMMGMITIDQYGNFSGCSEDVTKNGITTLNEFPQLTDEQVEFRSKVWDKCKTCDFIFNCGGYCYYNEPSITRCKWRIFNICEGIYRSLSNLTNDELEMFVKKQVEECP